MQTTRRINHSEAEEIAFKAVLFVASDEALLRRFLMASGCMPEDLSKELLRFNVALLVQALDFVLEADALILAFCDQEGLAPELPKIARAVLSGPEDIWP